MKYATIINGRQRWTGHLWQERFYSSVISDEYFLTAVRYVERNPVKPGLAKHACDYRWSSAKAHCLRATNPYLGYHSVWSEKIFIQENWYCYLEEEDSSEKIKHLRENTRRDFPCGNAQFVHSVEKTLGYQIVSNPRGRPKVLHK
jgi:putative transposase